MYPETKSRQKGNSLIPTIALLIGVFVLLVGVVLFFSSASSSLSGKCVAVVNLDDEISIQSIPASLFSAGKPGSEDIANSISSLNKRDEISGVLLVVNSPGGSVVATREIYNSFKDLKKPKVVYMREVAASGGYYVSSAADYIFADPNTITGSIGVITTFTDLSGLLDKVGVNVTAVKSGEYKDIGSQSRSMSDNESKLIKDLILEVYSEFKGVVLENRKGKLDMARFDNATDGRILSGRQAKSLGLIDQLGTKKDALKYTANLSGIDANEPRVCQISTSSADEGLLSIKSLIGSISNRKLQIKFE
ncbi:MAG: signal peptide peptidase SppA [Candidatus Micrarchaeota archaeon]